MLYQGGEREKIHTLGIGGHVQMASDPEAQRKFSLSDCTWLENEYGSLNLEALKFLMHFREPGSSFFYTLAFFFFFFFLYIFLSFFLSFSFSSFFSFSSIFLFAALEF
jgi:hypothetical protein